jgi:hypothetical protein
MRFLVGLFALLVTVNQGWASTIPVTPPPNIGSVSGGWATIGRTVVNGGAASIEMEARMAGVVAEIPAVARIGSGAAAVGLAAIRLNPIGLATSAIAQYLLQAGIQACTQPGGWCVPSRSPSAGDVGFNGHMWYCSGSSGASAYGACAAQFAKVSAQYSYVSGGLSCVAHGDGTFDCATGHTVYDWSGNASPVAACVSGYVASGSSCVPDPNAPLTQAAGDADWNKALTYPLPDQVVTDLSAFKVPLPLTVSPNPAPVTVNLGDPYVDPVTGKRYRDVAVITPNSDGKTATLNVVKQEVDSNGNPVTDPTTNAPKPPEKQDDPCTGHETRMGCAEEGDIPESPDLKESTVSVAITPDGGWGADNASCPTGTFSVRGFSFAVPWGPVCSFASMVRPLVIALAWLAAAFIVVGARQGGGGE